MRSESCAPTMTMKGGARDRSVPAEHSAESCVKERGNHDGSDGDSHS